MPGVFVWGRLFVWSTQRPPHPVECYTSSASAARPLECRLCDRECELETLSSIHTGRSPGPPHSKLHRVLKPADASIASRLPI